MKAVLSYGRFLTMAAAFNEVQIMIMVCCLSSLSAEQLTVTLSMPRLKPKELSVLKQVQQKAQI